MTGLTAALARIRSSPALLGDFLALCDVGGRFAGTDSEARARDLLAARLEEAARDLRAAGTRSVGPTHHRFDYAGWARVATRLALLDGGPPLAAHALVRSPATPAGGVEAEVLDLGRGAPADFEAAGDRVAGRLVLVRHEYPFAGGVVHRRVKYGLACERGAAGFLIASDQPGDVLVTGSAGSGAGTDVPAAGVTLEAGAALAARRGGRPARARLEIAARVGPARAANLLLEVPGAGPEWVVLSAHYDGHDLAESALDNATGVAAALEVVRALGPPVAGCPRGLRVALFTVEEWGLLGSRLYVDGLPDAERRRIALDVNLDTVAGSPRLTALVSGFGDLEAWVRGVAADAGLDLRTVLPLMPNSDHASFARAGIPALRLVAGFDDPAAGPRHLLTSGDTRDKVPAAELRAAAATAATLVWYALRADRIAAHRPAAAAG